MQIAYPAFKQALINRGWVENPQAVLSLNFSLSSDAIHLNKLSKNCFVNHN